MTDNNHVTYTENTNNNHMTYTETTDNNHITYTDITDNNHVTQTEITGNNSTTYTEITDMLRLLKICNNIFHSSTMARVNTQSDQTAFQACFLTIFDQVWLKHCTQCC